MGWDLLYVDVRRETHTASTLHAKTEVLCVRPNANSGHEAQRVTDTCTVGALPKPSPLFGE
jgi:hypothetical protein